MCARACVYVCVWVGVGGCVWVYVCAYMCVYMCGMARSVSSRSVFVCAVLWSITIGVYCGALWIALQVRPCFFTTSCKSAPLSII